MLAPEACAAARGAEANAGVAEGRRGHRAKLNWQPVWGEMERKTQRIYCAVFIENGRLSFFRGYPGDHWHSTGVICEGLPQHVLCCVFMFAFKGYTDVRFTGVWR